jgi:eukaryotic-like serine/threonine-protein kinase
LRPVEKRLDSWKEIAAYLNRGVRTVQRWEQIAGLPIHRVPHEKKGGVYALSGELDAWWKSGGARLANEPGAAQGDRLLNRPWYIVTCGLTLTAGIVFAWWALRPSPSPVGPPPRLVPLTTLSGLESFPAFSPDGSRIAFTWQRENESGSGVYTQVIRASGSPLLLSRNGTRPAWSPDGRFVSYFRNKRTSTDWDLVLTPASGGAERIIAQIPALRYLPGPFQAWTRDGNWIIVPERAQSAGPYALTAISVANGNRRRLTDPPSKSYGDGAPAISKDGRTLAFVRSSSLSVDDIFVQPFEPGREQAPASRRLTHLGWLIRDLFWDRSGRDILFVADSAETRRLWRISTYRAEQPRLITSINALGDHVVISPKGDRLVYADIRHNLQMWRQTIPQRGEVPQTAVRLAPSTRSDANPRVSPDRKRIAFGSDRTGSFEIWVADSDGRRPAQLTALGSYTGGPRWSPDSSQIAFDTRVNGNADIYVVSVDSGKVHQLTREPSNEYVPSWSRDGKWIYFISDRSGLNQLWKIPADGGPATEITHGRAADGIESTDGKCVYFARDFDVTGVWRVPSSGGAEEKVFDGLLFPLNFEVSSEGIYYLRAPTPEDPTPALVFYSFQSRQSEKIATIEKSIDNGLGVSSDGKWFIYAAAERVSGDLMMIENFR